MQASFWHHKWETGNIGFHQSAVNPQLTRYFSSLAPALNARVFIPLCGKTRDISWLLEQGCHVVGVELNKQAVDELFQELKLAPKIEQLGGLHHYSADKIDIYQGDIFQLHPEHIGTIDIIYDRAALVALPATIRKQYAQHLLGLSAKAPQLLICYEYQQQEMQGPPFSIEKAHLNTHYAEHYDLILLERTETQDAFKNKIETSITTWQLQPK